ncbi:MULTISPECIES: hypothetical protein [unclassified Microcoleus]|uniref:hypothetical protein n=1 Tax=unclassified Microcoleus TaxID=2642155 RepID=UPI002FD6F830
MNWNYLAECLRLLYWIYFKPFTLAEWVREIHPDLKSDTNPFTMRAEFRANPKLRRYAGQVWFLTVAVPPITALLVGIIYSLAVEPFNWSRSSLVLIGWFLGNCLARLGSQFCMPLGFEFRMPLGMLLSVVLGVALGVLLSVLLGVSGVASVVVLGVALGVSVGVLLGVSGVVSGVAGGVTMGVAVGVAFGVVFILSTVRVYFWIPELLWMFFLLRFVPEGDEAKWLRRLPPYFDQIIHLPMPLMDSFIVKAYQQNPVAAEQTLNYLIDSTNQQKVALKAMVGIAIDTLNRCQNSQDIVAITEQLAWIPSPPPAEIGSILSSSTKLITQIN